MVAAVALPGCKAEPAGGAETETAVPAAPEVQAVQSAPAIDAVPMPRTAAFDVKTLPVSEVAPGACSYSTLPAGYTSKGPGKMDRSATKD